MGLNAPRLSDDPEAVQLGRLHIAARAPTIARRDSTRFAGRSTSTASGRRDEEDSGRVGREGPLEVPVGCVLDARRHPAERARDPGQGTQGGTGGPDGPEAPAARSPRPASTNPRAAGRAWGSQRSRRSRAECTADQHDRLEQPLGIDLRRRTADLRAPGGVRLKRPATGCSGQPSRSSSASGPGTGRGPPAPRPRSGSVSQLRYGLSTGRPPAATGCGRGTSFPDPLADDHRSRQMMSPSRWFFDETRIVIAPT